MLILWKVHYFEASRLINRVDASTCVVRDKKSDLKFAVVQNSSTVTNKLRIITRRDSQVTAIN